MVRLSSTLELLVESGASSGEQYELLRWVRCLSPQGLADRAGALALLERITDEAAAIRRNPATIITGAPTTAQAQVSGLRAAGYLDQASCERFDSWPGEPETVARIVSELRAALGPGPAARRDTIRCQTCDREVPAGARYCGYCGIRV